MITSAYSLWRGTSIAPCPICRKRMRTVRHVPHIRKDHPIAGPRWLKAAEEKIQRAMNAMWAKLARAEWSE